MSMPLEFTFKYAQPNDGFIYLGEIDIGPFLFVSANQFGDIDNFPLPEFSHYQNSHG